MSNRVKVFCEYGNHYFYHYTIHRSKADPRLKICPKHKTEKQYAKKKELRNERNSKKT